MANFLESLDSKHRIPGLKVAYLHNVAIDTGKAQNSNKFYYLYEQSNGSIKIVRGRIDQTEVVEPKSPGIHEWDGIIRKKCGRGTDAYTDVTHLFQEVAATVGAVTPTATLADIQNIVVKKLFDDLQSYANKSIKQNYTISSDKVTEAMVNEAQITLDNIAKEVKIGAKKDEINKHLQRLFMIVPRRMSNVKDHLIQNDINNANDLASAQTIMQSEQATLDVMIGQVAQIKAQKDLVTGDTSKAKKETVTLLQTLGLECDVVTDQKELDVIMDMLNDLKRKGQQDNRKIFKKAFRVVNKKTQARFDNHLKLATNKQCQLLWHGSRNANYLSICQTGLELRPAANGTAFGAGLYAATHSGKSLNYSDFRGSYRSYTGGSSNQAFLLLFDFHIGKQKVVSTSGNYTLRQLQQEGCDSLWAKPSSGSYIAYDEFIFFQESQCTIKYLIEIQG